MRLLKTVKVLRECIHFLSDLNSAFVSIPSPRILPGRMLLCAPKSPTLLRQVNSLFFFSALKDLFQTPVVLKVFFSNHLELVKSSSVSTALSTRQHYNLKQKSYRKTFIHFCPVFSGWGALLVAGVAGLILNPRHPAQGLGQRQFPINVAG